MKQDDALSRLLDELLTEIDVHNLGIATGRMTVDDWQREMAKTILAGQYAAYFTGRGTREVSPEADERIKRRAGEQIEYLNRFADEVDANGWQDKYAARAQMYAGSVKAMYSEARYFEWPLPFQPAEGTECLTNCRCSWRVNVLDFEELDADATWQLSDAEHCPTCVARAIGNPYRIRGGVLL